MKMPLEVARKDSQPRPGQGNGPIVTFRLDIRTIAAAMTASAVACVCASLDWPVWAMFLGWVAGLAGGPSFRKAFYSYICLAAGTVMGMVAARAVSELTPIVGLLALATVVFALSVIVISMRGVPYFNIGSSYILGLVGVFSLHPHSIEGAMVGIAAPSAAGATGAWLAQLWLTKILDYRERRMP
jgi:hypothetical protein